MDLRAGNINQERGATEPGRMAGSKTMETDLRARSQAGKVTVAGCVAGGGTAEIVSSPWTMRRLRKGPARKPWAPLFAKVTGV